MSDYHVQKLKARHLELENSIQEEQTQRLPDTMRIRDLKKQKLAVRDQLHRFVAKPSPAQHHAHAAS